jgi:NADH-quinone oxidoreductase subunit G
MPTLTINGQDITVEQGTSLLQAAEMIGAEIPRFCYHDRLNVPANCRMCLVEVKGARGPVASCAMAAGDGMEVETDSELVHKARKGVMEFLLINHPLDCPICDQGGECDLQDQAMAYGFDRSRYHENKRAVRDKDLGPLIKTIMTRCIHCTRCVRFGQEIAGMEELGMLNRGEDSEINTYLEHAVTSELSGNMIDICPVGALTSKPYAFQARPWELRKTPTIDVHDAVGSNIRVDARGGEVMRVLPRLHEDVNEEWINDRTRFAYDGLKRQRLDRPYLRDNDTGRLRASNWEEVFAVLSQRLKQARPERIGALAGDLCDLESMVALKDLMKKLGSRNMDCRLEGEHFDTRTRAGYLFNTGIAGLEESDCILIVGANPRWEATMINARIRKTWLEKRMPIGVIGQPHDMTYPYTYIGEGPQSLQDVIDGKHDFATHLKRAEKPVVIFGPGAFIRNDGMAVHALGHELAEKFNMISDEFNGFNVMHKDAARVGALDIGFLPGRDGMNTGQMLESARSDQLDILYLLGVDHMDLRDRTGKNTLLVYQGHHGDFGANAADIVLPGAAYTEKDGLYVNTEGRVQMGKRAVHPPGDARSDWAIVRALSEQAGCKLSYDSLIDLRERIEGEWPELTLIDMKPEAEWGVFGRDGKIENAPFYTPIDNFYMTNVITRASQTMAQCTRQLLQKDQKQEAAE